jgi:hypothetical protein
MDLTGHVVPAWLSLMTSFRTGRYRGELEERAYCHGVDDSINGD